MQIVNLSAKEKTLPKWSRQCEHNNISVEEFKSIFKSTEKYLIAGGLFGSCGGLGNQMFRFAGLYGIGKPYGRIPIFLKRQNCHRGFEAHESEGADEMDRLFPNYAKYLKFSLNTFVADRPNETRVLNGFASDCCRYDDPKRINFTSFAEKFISINAKKAIEFTYKYLTQKHQRPVAVVLFGEDKKFFGNLSIDRKLIRSIYTPKSMSRAEDLVFVSTTCDSMLITCPSSTFSWWMAYLMPDGATVFYSSKLEGTVYARENFLPEWIPLRLKENGTIVID
uniref:Glycosyl transferase family 11 n=1 Tax=Globodera pallida TaxID=36090 RepID=A0A183BZ79_GLOPA